MFDAYSVAVKLSLVNHISPSLAAIIGHFKQANSEAQRTQRHLTDIEQKLKNIKGMAVAGGALLTVGLGGLYSLKGPYEEAKKLAQAQANFQTLNLSAHENAQAFAKAASMSQKILGTNITDNVKAIHDLHTAFGDLHHALETSDDFAMYSIAAKVRNGGHDVEGLTYNAVKALEHRGGSVINDSATFRDELNRQSKVYFGSNGKVSASDFFHASQTGKMAYSLYDKDYLYGQFAAFMQAKSGSTAGTSGMTAFSSLVGGHMDNKAKGFLANLGLLELHVGPQAKQMRAALEKQIGSDPEMHKALKGMHILAPITAGMSDANSELFAHRPDKFINDVLVPAIRKRYGMDLSDQQIALLITKNFNRNTGDFLSEHVINKNKFEKDTGIFGKSMGFADAYKMYMKSPEGAELAAGEAWKNFLTLIGTVYLPVVTKGLQKLAGVLAWFTKVGHEHPKVMKFIVGGFITLFAVLAGAGIIALVVAGVSALAAVLGIAGPVILAITAGVAALAGALWAFWDDIVAIWDKAKEIAANVFTSIGNTEQASTGQIPDLPSVAPNGSNKTIQVHTQVNLDGRPVGQILTKHQERSIMYQQPTGPRLSDPNMSFVPLNGSFNNG
jgi:hypothetical protein